MSRAWFRSTVFVTTCLWLAACGGSSGGGSGSIWDPGGGVPKGGGDDFGLGTGRGDLPEAGPTELSPELQAAIETCLGEINKLEQSEAQKCQFSNRYWDLLQWAGNILSKQVATDNRLVGLDWAPHFEYPPRLTQDDQDVDVLECAQGTDRDPASGMNAFAIQHGIWMLDPLIDALLETSGVIAQMRAQNGGQLDAQAAQQAIPQIFAAHARGAPWTYMSAQDAIAAIKGSEPDMAIFVGALSFVFFHEMGHAELMHGAIKCVVQQGVETVLQRRGTPLTPERKQAVVAELMQLSRSTEAQADIYSLTVMRSAGFSAEGAQVLVLGLLGLGALGCMDVPEAQQEDCILGKSRMADHPPLDERALLIDRILVKGEDLTWMLDPNALARIRGGTCGDGVCQTVETAQTCPADCRG